MSERKGKVIPFDGPKTEKAREPTAESMGGHVNLKTVLSQASQI